MNRLFRLIAATAAILAATTVLRAAEPLRVFLRAGVKTHGPNQHDHPRFLGDWTKQIGRAHV